MKIYRYINGKRQIAEAPDDAVAIYLGPQGNYDGRIIYIDWGKKFYKEERICPFPEKWYDPNDLDWQEG